MTPPPEAERGFENQRRADLNVRGHLNNLCEVLGIRQEQKVAAPYLS